MADVAQGVSRVVGAAAPQLVVETLGRYFDDKADANANRELLSIPWQGVRKSWAEFRKDAEGVATALLQRGFKPGDRLGVWLPNRYEWLVTQFATQRTGIVLVNVNPAYRPPELEHACRLVNMKGLVVQPNLKSSDYAAILRELNAEGRLETVRHYFVCGDAPMDVSAGPNASVEAFDELAKAAPDTALLNEAAANTRPEDVCNIQFTSGTTGRPKAAALTHIGLLNNARYAAMRMRFGPDDSLCVPVPLYHCFGTVLGVLAAVTADAKFVLPSESFDPEATVRACLDEGCTAVHGVPAMFVQMLIANEKAPGGDRFRLRTGIMAGSPCPPETMRNVITTFGMNEVTICYGMTETSPVSFQTECDLDEQLRCESVGTVHPHTEAIVVNPETSDAHPPRPLPVGEVGELLVKGYGVFAGYDNQPAATAEAVTAGGFMRTGDLAVFDASGICRVVGRAKDLIIRGGENIYPAEVEAAIIESPHIADVAVVGVPHAVLGEEVAAFVIKVSGASEGDVDAAAIKAFLGERLAHFKVPKHVFVLEEGEGLPLTVTGKVQKFLLRERAASLVPP